MSLALEVQKISDDLLVGAIVHSRQKTRKHLFGISLQLSKAPVAILVCQDNDIRGFKPDGTRLPAPALDRHYGEFVQTLRGLADPD